MNTIVRFAWVMVLVGCGSDGSRGSAPVRQAAFPGEPADPGDGIDREDGTDDVSGARGAGESFTECHRDSDCARGDCIRPSSESTSGFCLVICAAPAGELGDVHVQPCARDEVCLLVAGSTGLCTRPCVTHAECPTGQCTDLTGTGGRLHCGPGSPESSPPTEASPPSEAS